MSLLGQKIGNIRIDALLGAGGMGEVYRGFDVKLERQVAVKTLRSQHRPDEEFKARFLREARILSRLESSAICQVYDLIEGQRADYLIFEFVEGRTLRELLTDQRLELEEALALAEKIAQALAVAHAERIVHRDLKPENVMVTPEGSVKILDFGISHGVRDVVAASGETQVLEMPSAESSALSHRDAATPDPSVFVDPEDDLTEVLDLGETSIDSTKAEQVAQQDSNESISGSSLDVRLTQRGSVIGTLAYMSPEQAGGQDLTEASDMFSFGLLLQEMLTGESAYEPGKPMHVLPRVALGQTRSIFGYEVDNDAALLVGDLLRVEPERRPVASETAERLRFILDRPRRLRRQRQRRQLTTAGIAFLLMVLTVVSVLAVKASRSARLATQEAARAETEAQRANEQAAEASREARRAQGIVDFLVDLFEAASPDLARGQDLSLQEVLAVGSARIDQELQEQPLVRARLKDTLGTIHQRLGNYPESERLLTAALRIRRENLPEDDPERAQSKQHLAELFADQGRFEEAEALLRDAMQVLERAEEIDAKTLALVINSLATLMFDQGDYDTAETLYKQSLELKRAHFGEESSEVAENYNNLAVLAWQVGDYPRAGELYERALAIYEAKEDHPILAAILNNLGILHRHMGKLETSEQLHRRSLGIAEKVLGKEHREVAAILDSYARLLVAADRLDEAQPFFERAYAIRVKVLGEDSYEVGRTLTSLGDLLRQRGEQQRALAMLRRARRLLNDAIGTEHPWALDAVHALANVHRDLGQKTQAVSLYREALETATRLFSADHPQIAAIESNRRQLEE